MNNYLVYKLIKEFEANNIVINNFGDESVDKLTVKDIKKLAKMNLNAFVYIIELLNFNEKLPENHSFCTTSLDGKFTNIFDPDTCEIKKITKNDFFDIVFDGSIKKLNDLIFRFEFKINEDENLDDKFINSSFNRVN